MSGARRGMNELFDIFESDVVAIDQIIELPVSMARPHCFAGVQFFSDAGGQTMVIPTDGTVTISVMTFNTMVYEEPPEPEIIANSPRTISWDANSLRVRAVPSLIVGATHYKIVVTQNEG